MDNGKLLNLFVFPLVNWDNTYERVNIWIKLNELIHGKDPYILSDT